MLYFVGKYSSEQCGCDEVIFMIATSEYWANRYLVDNVDAYGYSYEFHNDEDKAKVYWENVTYKLREISEEEADDIGIEEFINIADYGYSDNYK